MNHFLLIKGAPETHSQLDESWQKTVKQEESAAEGWLARYN